MIRAHSKTWEIWVFRLLLVISFGRPLVAQLADQGPIPVVDVLVLWTPAFQSQSGPALPGLAQGMVDEANTVLMNSRARVRLRLVHSAKIPYPVGPGLISNFSLDQVLERLLDPMDGYLDEAHLLRDRFSADLVVLLATAPYGQQRVAPMATRPDLGFGVMSGDYGGYQFIRLVARLFGCGEPDLPLEALGIVSQPGLFPDSHGMVITNQLGSAYSTLADLGGVLPVFSNPDVFAFGLPLGQVGVADNVRTLNVRAAELAAFRPPLRQMQPPVVTWLQPAAGSVLVPQRPLMLEVSASSSAAPIREVEIVATDPDTGFFAQSALAKLTVPPFRYTVRSLPPQWHRLRARATDSEGNASVAEVEFRTPPVNDDFAHRLGLKPDSDRVPVRLGGTSLEAGEVGWGPGIAGTAWWTWTAPAAGVVKLDPQPGSWGYSVATLRVFRGATWDSLVPAAEVPPNTPAITVPVRAGEPLQLALGTPRFTGPDSPLSELALTFYPESTNDAFRSATVLSGTNLRVSGHNVGAGGESDIPSAPWLEGAASTWWVWTPPRSGLARIQMEGRFAGFGVQVFQGSGPENLNLLGAGGAPSTTVIPTTAGEPLYIAVASSTTATGRFEFQVELLPQPVHSRFADRRTLPGTGVWPMEIPGPSEEGAPESTRGQVTWWEWTAPTTGRVVVFAGYDGARVDVFSGTSLAGLQPVPRVDTLGGVYLEVVAGVAYEIAVSWPGLPGFLTGGWPIPTLLLEYLPTNDAFDRRRVLTGMNPEWTVPSLLASREPGEPNEMWSSVWHSWTAPETGRATLSVKQMATNLYPEAAVFLGPALPALSLVRSRGYAMNEYAFEVQAGVEYHLALSGGLSVAAAEPATFQLRLDSAEAQRPPNDRFAGRFRLNGRQHTVAFDSARATLDADDPGIPDASFPGTLWWDWTVPDTGVATIAVTWNFAGVYRRQPDGTRIPVGYAHSNQRPIAIGVVAGETLELMVGCFQPGSLSLKLLPPWANDAFAGREELQPSITPSGKVSFAVEAETHGATPGTEGVVSDPTRVGNDRWWTWRPEVPCLAEVTVFAEEGLHIEQFRIPAPGVLQKVTYRQGTNGYLTLRFHAEPGSEYPLVMAAMGAGDSRFSLGIRLIPDAPPPGNDAFSDAALLEGYAVTLQANHRTSSAEPGEGGFDGAPAVRSVWWRWKAPDTGLATVRASAFSAVSSAPVESYPPGLLASPTPPRLSVLQGTRLDDLAPVPGSISVAPVRDLQTSIRFPVESGRDYWIAVDTRNEASAETGEFLLELVLTVGSDLLGDARLLVGDRAPMAGTLEGATPDGWQPDGGSVANVWWRWTAPRDLRVIIHSLNPGWTSWAVLRPSTLVPGVLVPVVSNFPGVPWSDVRRDFIVRAGQSFYIGVYGDPAGTTPFSLELEGLGVPVNDAFSGRLPLVGESVRLDARAENASREPGEPPHGLGLVPLNFGQSADAPTLWWSWTAPRDGTFELTTGFQPDLLPTEHNSVHEVVRAECFVYTGDALSALTEVAHTDAQAPFTGAGNKRVTFSARAGVTYQIAVCPLLEGERLWEDRKYHVQLALDGVADNRTAATARELEGVAPSFRASVSTGSDGLWWKWTAPASGNVQLGQVHYDLVAPLHLRLELFRKDETDRLVPLQPAEGIDGWSGVVDAGTTWWIRVTPWSDFQVQNPPSELAFDLSLALERLAESNDAFANRTRVTGAAPILVGDNTGATREPGEPQHGRFLGRGSQWWEWTVPQTGRWWVDSYGENGLSPPVGVYRGTALSNLVPVRDWFPIYSTRFTIEAQEGETLLFAVDNPNASTGRFHVDVHRPAPPLNDDFVRAAVLQGPSPVWTARVQGATAEADEPGHFGNRAQASVWWSWTAPATGPMLWTLESRGTTSPVLAVYRGDSLGALVRVADNVSGGSPAGRMVFFAEVGVTYHLAVDTGLDQASIHQWSLKAVTAPFNDSFSASTELSGSRIQTVGFNVAASLEPGEPNPAGPSADGTLWWRWTAPASGWTTVDTTGSEFDTRLAVYRGATLAALNLVALNDDEQTPYGRPTFQSSRVTFQAQAGEIYSIQVGGVGGGRGQVRLTLLGPEIPPPAFIVDDVESSLASGHIAIRGTQGQLVWIQASEDLVNWYWIGAVRFDQSGKVLWQDSSFPGMARFYRLMSVP